MSSDPLPDDFWPDELSRFLPSAAEALDEAFRYECCPICYVLVEVCFQYLAGLAKRWPKQPELRVAVCGAGGFCRTHTWRLGDIQSQMAIAEIHAEVLGSLLRREAAPGPCPLCHLDGLAERRLLDELVRRLGEPGARAEYRQSFGVCYPHNSRLLAEPLSPEGRAEVVRLERTATEELIGHLRGFLGKGSPAARPTRTDDENRSPRYALLRVGGNEKV